MKLLIVRREPVQEIAAEPATLDALKSALQTAFPARAENPLSPLPSLIGWPLVADPTLAPGLVHLRPTRRPQEPAEVTAP